jgi:hypothetical protein
MTNGIKGVRSHGQRGIDGLETVDLPDPGQPGPGQIRVRVQASS